MNFQGLDFSSGADAQAVVPADKRKRQMKKERHQNKFNYM